MPPAAGPHSLPSTPLRSLPVEPAVLPASTIHTDEVSVAGMFQLHCYQSPLQLGVWTGGARRRIGGEL